MPLDVLSAIRQRLDGAREFDTGSGVIVLAAAAAPASVYFTGLAVEGLRGIGPVGALVSRVANAENNRTAASQA